MIYHNASIGDTKNVICIEFGNGTVNTILSSGNDYKGLLLKSQDKTEIGYSSSEYQGKRTEYFEPEAALLFRNIESLQVVIDQLEIIKKDFELQPTCTGCKECTCLNKE